MRADSANPLTYRITTLGCRVNHAETRELASTLAARGFAPAPRNSPADVEVIHTCSVTNTAAAKSRHAVRRAARRRHRGRPGSPAPLVIVTGCYASTDPEEAAHAAGDDRCVLTHNGRASENTDGDLVTRFARRIDLWLHEQHACGSIRPDTAGCSGQPAGPALIPLPVVPPRAKVDGHIRAELKIQDGCDAHCTFCILPKIRSTLRSKPVDDVVREAEQLVAIGHKEIVLTGIFIGAYGHETALRRRQRHRYASPLADLLDAVAQVDGLTRLRISSMEPGDVDEPLLDAMQANGDVVVPHLHLPLQSGSDAILKMMNRQYRVGDYLDMVDHVNDALTTEEGLPPAITTDIICGFPGETDGDFAATVEIARRVGYLHMHVFPFSPKRGTAAARWADRFVDPAIARQRVRTLIDMENDPDDGLSIAYRRQLIGRRTRIIIEQPDADRPGCMIGRCDHYARVSVRTERQRGMLLDALITDVGSDDRMIGEPCPACTPLPVLTS